ncbi:MAG: flagellar hook basal-body protein [Polyangiaceae bacterium]
MGDGIYCALSGAIAQATALDVTATNLANVSTNGYHNETPVFREVLRQAGEDNTLRFTTVQTTAITKNNGESRTTGRAMDAALPENLYFAVKTDAGERYTRAGSLAVQADGTVTTKDGHPLLADNDALLKVPPGSDPQLTADGEIRTADASVGRLKMVTFPEPAWLVHEGTTLLAASPDSGAATPTTGQLAVGAVEESNGTAVTAMSQMISATRMFEAFQRAIETFHEADRRVATTTPGVT